MYVNKIKYIIAMSILFILNFNIYSLALDSYMWTGDVSAVSTNQSSNVPLDLKLESASAILIDQKTGEVLYEHNSHEQLRPASVTKIMTILLIMEALDSGKIALDDKVPCSQNASSMGGSQIWLDTREELTVNDMLKAICVVSANDCTMAMAEYLAGTEEAFVEQMNEKAKQLGMNDTNFKNCHGIDEDGHVTSAYDIGLMSKELLNNHPNITNYTTIWMDSLRNGKSELVNTNKLIRNYKGATGLKTGSTSLALYNLSASAIRNDLSLIAVIMRAPSSTIRFNEAKKLLDYGFANFTYTSIGNRGDIIQEVLVDKGIDKTVALVLENNVGKTIKKGTSNEISQEISINENISAPITEGDILGNILYTFSDKSTLKSNLIANKSIEKITLWTLTANLYKMWFNLFR